MKTLVIAPHPDDELLGCGGTLLRRSAEGGIVGWLIMTSMKDLKQISAERIDQRAREITSMRTELGIAAEHLYQLDLCTTTLDTLPKAEMVRLVAEVFRNFEPEDVLLPHAGDVHSDHRITFDVVAACTKWFRYPHVKRVLTYETLSETDASMDPQRTFVPNVFVDVSPYIDRKIELLEIYRSEMGEFPFPRSARAVRALAALRGAQAGYEAAESFQLLRARC